ncbi:MAG: TetR/AcrR family transcriptional regulator [Proteobacteria bacterium]|nr:TetR/AcrR family transcriptional regulator [Pseudomonadota bacterium]
MARPTNADSEATRKKLLAAAGELFSAKGPRGVSLREVARASGLSLGTVQYYFKNKEGLHRACREAAFAGLADGWAPMGQMLDGVASDAHSAKDAGIRFDAALEEGVRRSFRFSHANGALLRIIMRPLIDDGELDERWMEIGLVPFLDRASAAAAEFVGKPASDIRFDLQCITALGMRFALSSPRELARLAGLPPETSVEEALQHTEDGLVRVAQRILTTK